MAITVIPTTGPRVRELMRRENLSQRELADALGLSQAAIYRRLAGDVDFTITQLTVTADRLGVHVHELLAMDAA